jgi:dienelactone hydrolase
MHKDREQAKQVGRRALLTGGIAGAGLLAAAVVQAKQPEPIQEAIAEKWPDRRGQYRRAWLDMIGPFPTEKPNLELAIRRVDDIEGIECHYVTFLSEGDDRVPAYLLVPKNARPGPSAALVCPHPTSSGAGKAQCVGLTGKAPTDPPLPPGESRAYGLELARWGYVTLSIDLFGDGERIPQGHTRYDSEPFYERHPEWSMFGKNAWDCMRAVDVLETLDFVDPKRIGCIGHSLGGHTSLCAAAFDERIAVALSNCGKLGWVRDTEHWARPQDPNNKRGAVLDYCYIPNFAPYNKDQTKPIPCDFDGLMMLCAPRPLMIQGSEGEFEEQGTVERVLRAQGVYHALGAGDKIGMFSFPGGHNFPPVAKRFGFAWLDRWLNHTPAVPNIWPGDAV